MSAKAGPIVFFFTITAIAVIILCLAFFMLATAKTPKPMSYVRQKFTRILLFGVLWTTVLALTSHASYTLRSFGDGRHNLLNFRTYPTVPLVYIYSIRDNFNFWDSPLIESYYTLPTSFSEGVRATHVLSLSLAAVISTTLLFTSFNRCAKVAALISILVSFASFPFSLIYMMFPYADSDIFNEPTILWPYFLEQFISYLTVMVMVGLELRSMKTFSQLKQGANAALETGQLTAVTVR